MLHAVHRSQYQLRQPDLKRALQQVQMTKRGGDERRRRRGEEGEKRGEEEEEVEEGRKAARSTP